MHLEEFDLKGLKYFLFGLLFLLLSDAVAEQPPSNVKQKEFRFFVNADPQMGESETKRKDLPVLNSMLKAFVNEVNDIHQREPIDFVVYNGDLVWKPAPAAFDNFRDIVKKQNPPAVLVHGNHDGRKGDPGFLRIQQDISGYQKLNYSFDYGDWHFLVIAAQEKYPSKTDKSAFLEWLDKKLSEAKDKKVMVMMHYHLLPVGLSQMEYYSFHPLSFRNQVLDAITRYQNVKYVYSGHVHSGVKASIKSTKKYKGTVFVTSPTPVMARPFGEEFSEFEADKDDAFYRMGFYLEVKVKGDQVDMIGHKINHNHEVNYPREFKVFSDTDDPRFFQSELQAKPNDVLINHDFSDGSQGWVQSYRYQKDQNSAFINEVKGGVNTLSLTAPWGAWNKDEYMETYQTIELDLASKPIIHYSFNQPSWAPGGAGGYIRLFLYNEHLSRKQMLLFHWGSREKKVLNMYQSWFFNSTGKWVQSKYFQRKLKNNKVLSFNLSFDNQQQQKLSLNLKDILLKIDPSTDLSKMNKVSIAHGVWVLIDPNESSLYSRLNVEEVLMESGTEDAVELIELNGKPIKLNDKDKTVPYFTR